jgi:nucleoside-diphosphate-sugar epimerase
VVSLWRSAFVGSTVLAETRSLTRHAELAAMGATVRLRGEEDPPPTANVLVALPPSAVEDYTREVERAVSLWSEAGRLVLVSSTAVYAEEEGGICTERSPLARSPRATRLLNAEEVVLAAGGMVVRMAGLYDHHRGPHLVYLRTQESKRRPDGLINLIHYDDAADLCLAALARGDSHAVYVGCDDEPIQRQALVDATTAADGFLTRANAHRCTFTGRDGPLGRRCDNSDTRAALGWTPRHPSYLSWLESASIAAPIP